MTLAKGARLGPYEIVAPLGAGGMGEVYRTRDTRLGRDVALKVLTASSSTDPDRLSRFVQEARAASALNHPNILVLYDVGTQDGTPYIVTELLEGETLRERLNSGALGTRKAIEYAQQIAQGIAAAHSKGIIHRDLKPENVFLTRDGRVKILDFGLAKLKQTDEFGGETATHSASGLIVGTVGYMAPEQVRGQPVNSRADLFAFGAILYEMIAGQRAFQGDTPADTLSAILNQEPPEFSARTGTLSTGLDRIVRRCLEKSPHERFQSASDLAFALDALSGVSGATAELPRGVGRRAAGRWWPLVGGLLLLAAIAVSAFFAGKRAERREPPSFQQLTFRRGTIYSARFAPDGHTIVYGAEWEGKAREVFSTRIGSPEARSLFPDAGILSMSRDGDMAIALRDLEKGYGVMGGTLARAPLAGGAAREILTDVGWADWAPDGKTLAIVRNVGGQDRLEFPPGKTLYATAGSITHPRIARAGNRIAFLHHPSGADNAGSIVAVDLEGRSQTLSSGWWSVEGLAWPAEGDEIWFTAAATGAAQSLYAVSTSGARRLVMRVPADLVLQDISPDGRVLLTREASGSAIMGVAAGETKERDLSWLDGSIARDLSTDGTTLLIEESWVGGGAAHGIYMRGMDGSAAVKLGDGVPLAISPDKKWVLSMPSNAEQLMVVPAGVGEARTLPRGSIERYRLSAEWFPDGRRIVFSANERGQSNRIFVQDAWSGPPKPLTPEGIAGGLALSSDGSQIAVRDEKRQYWIFPIEGGKPRSLSGLGPQDTLIRWGSDGRTLYVYPGGEPLGRVYHVDISTGRKQPWKELAPPDLAGVWSILTILMTPDAKVYAYTYLRRLSDLYLVEGLK